MTLILTGILMTTGSPGLADGTSFGDDKDAFGPLDVAQMGHWHRRGTGKLVHKMTTYRRWQRGDLRSNDSEIMFLFTTDDDNKPERVLVIDVEGGRLVAEMHRWAGGVRDQVYGRANVRRPSRRGLRVVFRRSLLGRGIDEYGWHIDTRFHDPDHPRCNVQDNGTILVCPDSAPNNNAPRAYLRHDL